MSARSSTGDVEGLTLGTTALQLGKLGLDLRTSQDPTALSRLNNARFRDVDTIERRPGHTARLLRDNGLMQITPGPVMPDRWVFGHGTKISNLVLGSFEDAHYPWHRQSLATFRYQDNNVSWTGDRLLTHREDDDRCTGRSTFWWRYQDVGTPALDYGVPAYCPTMDDTLYADIPGTNSADTALSSTQRCIVWTTATKVFARVVNRDNGCVIDESELSGTTGAPGQIRVVYSGNSFVVLWNDTGDGNLHWNYYNGSWFGAAILVTTVPDWDVCPRGFEGFHLIYRTGSTLKARCFSGVALQTGPYASDTVVATGGTPSGGVAMAMAPDGTYGVVWQDSSPLVKCRTYTAAFVAVSSALTMTSDTATKGLTVAARGLRDLNGRSKFTAYAGCASASNGVISRTFHNGGLEASQGQKPGCELASRAFSLGNECFVWLLSGNSKLKFLIGGNIQPVVCGYADRGEAEAATAGASTRRLPGVAADPNSPSAFTWIRAKTASAAGTLPSRRVVGDVEFLPQLCTAQYGESVYLSGSAVQNFDGETVSDAGFQESPTGVFGAQDTNASGHLTLTSNYAIRVYVTRKNARGEVFISPGVTIVAPILTTTNNRIRWDLSNVQSCTDRGAQLLIFRTVAGGSTYYYEQTVANDQTALTTQVFSTTSDALLQLNPADPFAPQLGGLPVIQNYGPTGCRILVAHRDRLWLAGGQVPRGQVVYSKLKDFGAGAGFDGIAGSVTIDVEQRAITSLAGLNEALVVLHSDRLAILPADGPDNYGRGAFSPAQLVMSPGATTHRGTVLTRLGVLYWSSGGPHLLQHNGGVRNISAPVRDLASNFIPTGVRALSFRQDVVWFTAEGTALLWDYSAGDDGRWATWSGLPATSASETAISVADGRLFLADETVFQDGGVRYSFEGGTNWLRAEELLAGHNVLIRAGMLGDWNGPHDLRLRFFYNGKSLWEEEFTWHPDKETWLVSPSEYTAAFPTTSVASLTPAQLDTVTARTRGDGYGTHRRLRRGDCQRFRVEWSDVLPDGDSFIPTQLVFELGVRPGLGRTTVANFD